MFSLERQSSNEQRKKSSANEDFSHESTISSLKIFQIQM